MKYRFEEDKILAEVGKYIESTYSAHYVNEKAILGDTALKGMWNDMQKYIHDPPS